MIKIQKVIEGLKGGIEKGYTHVPLDFFGCHTLSFCKEGYNAKPIDFYYDLIEYSEFEHFTECKIINESKIKVDVISWGFEQSKEGEIHVRCTLKPIDDLPEWYINQKDFEEIYYDDFNNVYLEHIYTDWL